MTVPDGQTSTNAVIVDDYPEDRDGDAVMTTQEAQLLGHTFARQVTASGLRRSRSPQSSVGEPEPKQPQHQPEHVFDPIRVHTPVISVFGCDDSRCQARGPKCKFHEEFFRVQLWNLSSDGRFG
ncbi:hypothetical protein PHMEG_00034021 [Phytophthora megakarya]|uniref:Uncharacterized protein n=1 Tax=Phytophthora megakarya TaxID=4795 RepID=A0A225URZ4_9STRA|nr:hypothetical protein PHMEG_00034021 [Phytophthora megakarya]